MSLPDKCPFCGAAIAIGEDGKKRVADLIVIFDCGSGFDELIDPIRTRSRACKAITRVTELEAENKALRDRFSDADTERNAAQAALKAVFARVAELEARCKRLEEAGDAMLSAWLMPEDSMPYSDWVCLSSDAKSGWYAAKEAKP